MTLPGRGGTGGHIQRRLPPLEAFEAFEAAARLSSYAAAAHHLGISPAAARRRVGALERALGVALFQPKRLPLELSQEGRELKVRLSGALADISEATLHLARQKTTGTLTVCAGPTLASLWLMPRLKVFAAQWPGIHLNVVPLADNERAPTRADLSIIFREERPLDGLVQLSSAVDLFPVCSPSLLNGKPLRSADDLDGHTLLQCDGGEEWRKWLAAAGAKPLDRFRTFRFSNASLAVHAAIHGQGIALASHVTISHLLRDGRLVIPLKLSVASPSTMYVTSRKPLRRGAVQRAFVGWAATELRSSRRLPYFDAPPP